jgi:cellobiose transport system substrate-binding protein
MNRIGKAFAPIAVIALTAGVLTGCSTAGGGTDGGDVELTLSTFGEFGYEDLLTQFEDENPGITVTQRVDVNGDAARDATNTYLAAGSGLADVVAVESGWLAQMMQYPDKWTPVADDLADRWLEWKSAAATDADGVIRMYGVDAAPVGICYNRDLFANAGLPTDRAEVATLLTGDWAHFFDVGRDFTTKTGVPWINASSAVGQAQVQGLEIAFQDRDGEVVATTNPDVKAAYDLAVSAIDVTANMATFGEDWTKGLGQSSFATQICPSWMLGIIKSSAPDSTSWDVAEVFPGAGISWGGSYLAVPTQSEHPEEAQKLADWLTAPEQQLAAFKAVGSFPSQVEALADDALRATSEPFFQNAATGEIFSNLGTAIDVRPYNGPLSSQIMVFFNDALNRVEAGTDPAASWSQFESDVDSLS